ncbi:MAG: endolytic transglycosylase MltG [Candidatus Kaiserbacteria bacterium]|nr:endolytic transglycosylase MltG [Candidatus Kaiserbacteria bacterium]
MTETQTVIEIASPRYTRIVYVVLAVLMLVSATYFGNDFYNTPPSNFPIATNIAIAEGMTVSEITEVLKEHAVVRSSTYLYGLLLKKYDGVYVQAGTYTFEKPMTAEEVATAITEGDYLAPTLRITLPEGFRARDIYSFLPNNFEQMPIEFFEENEGYLFPETYFISPDMDTSVLKELLLTTAKERHSEIIGDEGTNVLTSDEIIILASLIEREAKDYESKKMVSGILQNRLNANMPLQVDAVFDYLLDKESGELTLDDLAIDSPFNTYTHTGLPPQPISNPGEESIRAVLEPTQSNYFYYLTSSDGEFHYAKSFEEHKRNKTKYLP